LNIFPKSARRGEEGLMARKRALKHRRDGTLSVPGLVNSLIGRFAKMAKRGELKPSVGHLIRLLELREQLAPGKVTVRWVDNPEPKPRRRDR
jgi:hypothetical protein